MASEWEKPVRVAERDIPRYAVHVETRDLKPGNVYFRLMYLDDQMFVPELVPLVFIGLDLDATDNDGTARFFFQDAGSYLAGVRWDDPSAPLDGACEEERLEQMLARGRFEVFTEGQVSVLSFEKRFESSPFSAP
jgi:hypothetical protein